MGYGSYMIIKALFINAACIALGMAIYGMSRGMGSMQNVCIILTCLVWLCNEIWFWLYSLLAITLEFIGLFKREDASDKTHGKLYRITSLSLLITPLLIYAALWVVGIVIQREVVELMGIPLTTPFAIASMASLLALWVATCCTRLQPLALEIIFDQIFETETDPMPDAPPVSLGNGEEHGEASLANIDSKEVLYRGKPELDATCKPIKKDFYIGAVLMLVVALFVKIALHALDNSALAAGGSFIISLLFFFIALSMLRKSFLWKKKLAKVEYIFTADNIYIVEGSHTQTIPIDNGLNIAHESISENVGNIHLAKSGKVAHFVNKILGSKRRINVLAQDISNISTKEPLHGFYQVKNSKEIYTQLVNLRDKKAG